MGKIPSFEDGNPSDWPSNFSEFKELETILGCGICFEYMSTAMMTKCSHNFCSLCIRRYICYKGQCPICLDAVLESDLRNNRIVDEIIQHFTKSRTKLLTLVRSNPGLDQSRSSSNCTDMKGSRSTPTYGRINTAKSMSSPADLGNSSAEARVSELDSAKNQKAKLDVLSSYFLAGKNKSLSKASSSTSSALNTENGDSSCVVMDIASDSDVTIDGDPVSNPPGRNSSNSDNLWSAKLTKSDGETLQSDREETKSHQSDSDFGSSDRLGSASSQSSSNQLGFSSPVSKPLQSAGSLSVTPSGLSSTSFEYGLLSPATATVACPVCNTDVPSRNINLHLDRCLATEQKIDRPTRQTLKRKPMPKLVYTLLSEKDLRKKLSEVGLPASGNRQALMKRHHEFTLLYNAQCDSLCPKSVQEIVSEMIQADALKSRLTIQSSTTTNLKLDKTSTTEQVELAQKEYIKKHKSQFKELINAARRNEEASSESTNSASMVAEPAATSSDADLASEAIVTEPSSPDTENNSTEPQIKGTSQRDPETESNLERTDSPKTSTSADFHVSRPIRRIRRKLDHSLSVDTHRQPSGTEEKESACNNHQATSVAVRRSLRSHANKKKLLPPDLAAPADIEDTEDSEDVNTNADNDDDDYEIMPSYSGRKRKAGNNNKVPRPPKTTKPENMAEEPSKSSSPVF